MTSARIRLVRRLGGAAAVIALVGCSDTTGTNDTGSTVVPGVDTTMPVATTAGAPTPDTPAWTRVGPPRVEGSTDAVVTGAGGLVDGTYWAVLDARSTGATTFSVMRAHFGAACEVYVATVRGVQCMSGYTVQREPGATVPLAPDAAVSVAALDDDRVGLALDDGRGDLGPGRRGRFRGVGHGGEGGVGTVARSAAAGGEKEGRGEEDGSRGHRHILPRVRGAAGARSRPGGRRPCAR